MGAGDAILLAWCSAPDGSVAQAIAAALVERRLAACVQVLPGVRSVYRWQGQVEQAHEVLLLAKTTAACWPELVAAIRALHPYELPEILALPLTAGFEPYLDWIRAETVSAG